MTEAYRIEGTAADRGVSTAAGDDWRDRAMCREIDQGDVFFPELCQSQYTRDALAICARCPVRDECLEYALDMESRATGGRHGIWGGTTPNQRARIAKRRGIGCRCSYCGAICQRRRGPTTYCSRECAVAGRREAHREYERTRRNHGRTA